MDTILNKVMVYVGTKWLTLGDYKSYEEFINTCKDLHNDEEYPELMFRDWICPEELRGFISKKGINENLYLLNDVGEDEEKVIAYLEYVGEITEKRINDARDNYIGEFESYYELGEYFADELDLLQMTDSVRNYFDFEAYGRDVSYDLIEARDYYFWG